jgi:hypothetical protein
MKIQYRSFVSAALVASSLFFGVQAASAASSTATLTGGSLTITSPASNFSYPSTQLTGDVFNLTSSFAVGVNDATGSKAGWKLMATIDGPLTDPAGDIIPASGHTILNVLITPGTGTAPDNSSMSYGTAIPTTAAKVFSAAVNTGKGRSTETFNTQLAIPADAAAGDYSALMTVSIVSGP